MEEISLTQYQLVYNAFSFGLATMMAATLFFWLQRSQVADAYKTALTITGLVTFIAAYHYFRIYESWLAAFEVNASEGTVALTEHSYNQAYRYVDWLLTVPLLLIELILVMNLSRSETITKGTRLGILAAVMIALGYPGEISDVESTRWFWWALSMIPFLWILYELFVGLSKSIAEQPQNVRGLVNSARWLTLLAWSFYPVVFIFPMIGMTGGTAVTFVEIGYTVADITAKAVFGVVIYMIAKRKSESAV